MHRLPQSVESRGDIILMHTAKEQVGLGSLPNFHIRMGDIAKC